MTRDAEARRALGNGSMLAFVTGADVRELFGPVYSSPQAVSLRWAAEVREEDSSRPGVHTVTFEDESIVSIHVVDACPAVRFDFRAGDAAGLSCSVPVAGAGGDWSRLPSGEWVCEIPLGSPIYIYPSDRPLYAVLAGDLRREADGRFLAAEEGAFALAVSPGIAGAIEAARHALRPPREVTLSLAENRMRRTLQGLTAPAIHDVGVDWWATAEQILAQQSADGGFVAGHNYALAYLRDQFGVCEGLLALGLFDAVRRNIAFRLSKWAEFGDLANAEGMGTRTRHTHENDDVEQTAYMVLQILRYADASGDREILTESRDLVMWCLDRQADWLWRGSLPFNGDETYVAGGLLPRWALEDGSLEATALYAAALQSALDAPELDLPQSARLRYEAALAEIAANFEWNFRRDDVLVTNSLARRQREAERTTRRGVCESCERYIVDTVRLPHGRFVCTRCIGSPIGPRPDIEMVISAASFVGFLVSGPLPDPSTATAIATDALDGWLQQHTAGHVDTDMVTGFDGGLLLRAAIALRHPAAAPLADHVSGLVDRYSMWAEFYRGPEPVNTRCRAWESGLNVAALHSFGSTFSQKGTN